MKYDSYVNSFLEYILYELNYSKKTKDTYYQALKSYGKFLEEKKEDFLKVNKDGALKYKAYLVDKYKDKTGSLNLSAVRSFYNYLVEIKMINSNPFLNIHNPKIIKKLPNFLKESEEEIILKNKDNETVIDKRNRFIVKFLYATGLRVSELVSLKVSDLNSDKTIKVMGKGSKERIIYYNALKNQELEEYFKIRKEILEGKFSEYLFVGKSGKALSTRSIELIVREIAKDSKINSKITPHSLRHTYATDLLNNGADIRSVGELLGHESLSTTQIYTHVTSKRLKEVYNLAHPKGIVQEKLKKNT